MDIELKLFPAFVESLTVSRVSILVLMDIELKHMALYLFIMPYF